MKDLQMVSLAIARIRYGLSSSEPASVIFDVAAIRPIDEMDIEAGTSANQRWDETTEPMETTNEV